jgi:hypothetical protein
MRCAPSNSRRSHRPHVLPGLVGRVACGREVIADGALPRGQVQMRGPLRRRRRQRDQRKVVVEPRQRDCANLQILLQHTCLLPVHMTQPSGWQAAQASTLGASAQSGTPATFCRARPKAARPSRTGGTCTGLTSTHKLQTECRTARPSRGVANPHDVVAMHLDSRQRPKAQVAAV